MVVTSKQVNRGTGDGYGNELWLRQLQLELEIKQKKQGAKQGPAKHLGGVARPGPLWTATVFAPTKSVTRWKASAFLYLSRAYERGVQEVHRTRAQ